jgi:hypothetical protein
MAIRDTQILQGNVDALAASAAYTTQFVLPRKARIKRYYAASEVVEAAHSTQVLNVTYTNKGPLGTGTTVMAVLTNDSDLADAITRESSAWDDHVIKEIDTENRPGSPTNAENSADEIEAGSIIEVEVAKASGTQTGAVTFGIEFIWSD